MLSAFGEKLIVWDPEPVTDAHETALLLESRIEYVLAPHSPAVLYRVPLASANSVKVLSLLVNPTPTVTSVNVIPVVVIVVAEQEFESTTSKSMLTGLVP
jgi:hypothetical protein